MLRCALLDWGQQKLAQAANVSITTRQIEAGIAPIGISSSFAYAKEAREFASTSTF